jgi:hypothetical protein
LLRQTRCQQPILLLNVFQGKIQSCNSANKGMVDYAQQPGYIPKMPKGINPTIMTSYP